MRSLRFLRAARTDITEARSWYEEQRPDLGRRFVEALEKTLGEIAHNPLLYPVIDDDIRRALLERFPYGVFYHLDGASIVVTAVVHDRRNPSHWRRRRISP